MSKLQLTVNVIHAINIVASVAAGFWPGREISFTIAASMALNTWLETLIPKMPPP